MTDGGVELVVTAGTAAGARARLAPGARLVLGRGDGVGLLLPDNELSRQHAAVEHAATGVVVLDLGSKNGTRLAGRPLAPHTPTPASDGDVLALGGHEVTLRVAGQLRLRDAYERLADLGGGGMGHVFAARHRATGRRVAIKALHTPAERDPVARERLRREAAVRVDSPHVVQVLDVVLEEERMYLVLELVEGGSLERALAAGPLPVARALEVAEHVALALDAAHRAGVVHRDVKPANVLIDAAGAAKLGDFGIARRAGAVSLTASGLGLGTMSYVSPEQAADAKRAGPAADIYALGATLFHALTGRPPFPPGPDQVRALFEDEPPPVSQLRPDVPRDVTALVARLLEKEPADRPPGAAAVARRLRELRGSRP